LYHHLLGSKRESEVGKNKGLAIIVSEAAKLSDRSIFNLVSHFSMSLVVTGHMRVNPD
jgi:hypothetical protein